MSADRVRSLITGAQLPRMSCWSCADILFHILQARTLRCISNRNLWWGAWSCTGHCIRIKPDIALLCNPDILVELSSMILCQWMSQNSWLTHLTEFSPTIWQIITDLWILSHWFAAAPTSIRTWYYPPETTRNENETWLKVHLSGLSVIMSECTCTIFGSQTTQQLEKNTILPLASSNPDVLVFGIDNGPRWRYVKQWNTLLAMFLLHKWSILRRWTERWCVWQGIQKWNEKVFDYRFLSRVLMGKTGLKRLCSSVPTYFVLNKNPTNILFIIPRYNLWSLAICFSAFCPEANFWLGLKLVYFILSLTLP